VIGVRKSWTPEEVAIVLSMPDKPNRGVGMILGRTAAAIGQVRHRVANNLQRYRLCKAKRPITRRFWTDEEIIYLRTNYGYMSKHRLAKRLKRSAIAVAMKAKKLGLDADARDRITGQTTVDWARMLGINHDSFSALITRGVLKLSKDDGRYGHIYAIGDETIEAWLRSGQAVRCTVNAHTPRYYAQIIAEVKAQYISDLELRRIDPWLAPHRLSVLHGMAKMPRLVNIRCGDGEHIERLHYYRKDDIYAWVYNCAFDMPVSIKDPYFKAIRLAWESVYIRRSEINAIVGHAKTTGLYPVCYGVYNRGEFVAWLRAQKVLRHRARDAMQDPISYQELHRDIERRRRQGQPI